MVDYKLLLAKYIAFVGDEEGSTFLSRIGADGRGEYSAIRFSSEELAALEECSAVRMIPGDAPADLVPAVTPSP